MNIHQIKRVKRQRDHKEKTLKRKELPKLQEKNHLVCIPVYVLQLIPL